MQTHLQLQRTCQQYTHKTITCVVVSKKHTIQCIEHAHTLGFNHFAENYLQEARIKINALQHLPITWHFIGQIQNNKTKAMAEHFDWVQTITSFKTAKRLSDARAGKAPLFLCIQATLDEQAHGVLLQDIDALAQAITSLPNLHLRGLFFKPPGQSNTNTLTAHFKTIQTFFQKRQLIYGWDTLSMGMSGDFPLALQHQATMIRLGTYLLGPRS